MKNTKNSTSQSSINAKMEQIFEEYDRQSNQIFREIEKLLDAVTKGSKRKENTQFVFNCMAAASFFYIIGNILSAIFGY